MGPLHIALIAVNIIVPILIWKNNAHENNQPIEFKKFEDTLTRVVSTNGGSSCATSEIVKDISKLCTKSDDQWKETATAVIEQVEGDFMVSCEVRDDGMVVQIAKVQPSNEPACLIKDAGDLLSRQPAFLFEHKGTLHSISYDASSGEREFVMIPNCRKKLKRAKKIKSHSLQDFEDQIGGDDGDPADLPLAIHMCVVFDPALGWNFWRRKYKLLKN